MAVKPLQSVETALRVLETVAGLQPTGVSAISRELGLDKNAVQRSLVTLGATGWIRHPASEAGAWELTAKALRVGRLYAPGLAQRVRPHLEALQAATGETAVLFARDGDRLVALDVVDSAHALRLTVPLGTTVPIIPVGAFDAFLTDDERAELPRTTGAPSAASIASVRHLGYYVLDEAYPSSVAVGAPVFDERRCALGTILVVAPRSRLSGADRRRVGELVARAGTAASG